MVATCLRLGCQAKATHTLIPQYGRASVWCQKHGKSALATVAFFENRQTDGARLLPGPRPLPLPRPSRGAANA